MTKKPNILLFGIDSLRSDHMSLYGYDRLTTPHIDKYIAVGGILFENMFSPSIPTTPGYASMLTGLDCFGTDEVRCNVELVLRSATPISDRSASLTSRSVEKTLATSGASNTRTRGFSRRT